MQLRDALLLVRETYLEEQKGIVNGARGQQYRRAIQDYPATMATALEMWVAEVMEPGSSSPRGSR